MLALFFGCNSKVSILGEEANKLPPNDPPVLASYSCAAAAYSQNEQISCSGTASDINNDKLTYSFSPLNTCHGLTINPLTGEINQIIGYSTVGTCLVSVQVSDGRAYSGPQSFALTVANVAPTLSISDVSVNEDTILNLPASHITASKEGSGLYFLDTTTVTAPGCHNHGTININAVDGAFTFTPALNWNGDCFVKVNFNDGNAGEVNAEFKITVNPVNDPPVIGNSCPGTGDATVAYNCNTLTQFDVEGSPLTWSLPPSNECSWASINSSTGVITGTPPSVQLCRLTVRLSDGQAFTEYTRQVQIGAIRFVTNVTADKPDGSYTNGDVINIQLTFDSAVVVNTAGGVPRLIIETGLTDQYASYVSGSGTTTLVFKYNVTFTDISTDLDLNQNLNSIQLNGSTIIGAASEIVSLTVPVGANVGSLATNKNIVITNTYPVATLSNTPTLVSPTSITKITVGGTSVVAYKYKAGPSATTICSNVSNYGSEANISVPLIENVSTYTSGAEMKICVLGRNAAQIWQVATQATEITWKRGEYSINPLQFVNILNIPNWFDVIINGSGDIYGRNATGEMLVSADRGINWTLLCTVPHSYTSKMFASYAADGNVYAQSLGEVYRVTNKSGGSCDSISSTLTSIPGDFFTSRFSVMPNGDLYFVENGGANDIIHKSVDYGTTWTSTTLDRNVYGYNSTIYGDQNDPARLLKVTDYRVLNADTTDRVWDSTDSGTTWNRVNPIRYSSRWYVSSKKTPGSYIDTYGTVYTDHLATNPMNLSPWTSYARFAMDQNDRTYWFISSGNNTQLYVTPNPQAVNGTLLYTFSGILTTSSNRSVSAAGSTVAIVLGNRMFMSSDYGTSFNEVNWQGKKLAKLASISSEDGINLFGVTPEWNILSSTNSGLGWSFRGGYPNYCTNAEPFITTNQGDPQFGLITTNNSAPYCRTIVRTFDGFSNYSVTGDSAQNIFGSIINHKESLSVGLFTSNSQIRQSVDGTESFRPVKNLQLAIGGTLFQKNYSDPMDKDSFISGSSAGLFYRSNALTSATVAINSLPGGFTIAGFKVFKNTSETDEIRAIDRVGKIAKSLDNGISFTQLGTSPALASCTRRFIEVLPSENAMMAQACLDGDVLTFTRDNGSTWKTIDLFSSFAINCDIRGLALTNTKIFVACRNFDIISVDYQPFELINEARDSYISLAERALNNPLINNTIASNYSELGYKIIPNGSLCDSSLTFSASIPSANSPDITGDGNYQVCVKLKDFLGNVFYEKSTSFRVDTGLPSFTSIALLGELSDNILTQQEIDESSGQRVIDNLVGANFDYASFALVESSVACNLSLTYRNKFPDSSLAGFNFNSTKTSWKFCVRLSDTSGNASAYGASPTFTFNPTLLKASLSGLPKMVDNKNALNVTVAGSGIVAYKYKVIPGLFSELSADGCLSPLNYSASIPVSTPITNDLTSYSLNTSNNLPLNLCVIGGDGAGNWQVLRQASMYQWARYKYTADDISLRSTPTKLDNWIEVSVSRANSSVIYAVNQLGEVLRSSNIGSTWTLMCQLPGFSYNSNYNSVVVKTFPNDQNKALVMLDTIYAVEQGSTCRSLNPISSSTNSLASGVTSIDIDSDGVIVGAFSVGYDTIPNFLESKDFGNSWSKFGDNSGFNGNYRFIRVSPYDKNKLFLSVSSFSNGNPLFVSKNRGKTWQQSIFNGYGTDLQFHPTSPDIIYPTSNYSTYSVDGGISFTTNSSMIYDYGKTENFGSQIYYIYPSSPPIIARMNLLTPSSFTNMFTINDIEDYNSKLSSNHPVIATITDGQLLISSNGGTSFTEILSQGTHRPSLNVGIFSQGGDSSLQYSQNRNLMHFSTDKTQTYTPYAKPYGNTTQSRVSSYFHSLMSNDPNWLISMPPASYLKFYAGPPGNPGIDISANQQLWYMTSYAGQTWMSFSEENPSLGYYITMQSVNSQTTYNIFKTIDNGRSWQGARTAPTVCSAVGGTESLGKIVIDPNNSNRIIFAERYCDNGRLFEYDSTTNALLDITPRLNLTSAYAYSNDVVDLSFIKKSMGGHDLIVVTRNGSVRKSTDIAQSFSVVSDDSQGTSSKFYFLNSAKDDSNLLIAGSSSDLFFSRNGGINWETISLQSYKNSQLRGSFSTGLPSVDGTYIYTQSARIKHTPVNESLQLADRILDVAEQGLGDNLVSPDLDFPFGPIEYAIIPAATTCSSALVFTTTVPRSNDPILSSPGDYKICYKISYGNDVGTVYQAGQILKVIDGSSPVFTSIDLVHDVADGILSGYEASFGNQILVGNLVASNYTNILYSVQKNVTVCDNSLSYKYQVPYSRINEYGLTLVEGESYKVCIKLFNSASQTTFGSSASFTYLANYGGAVVTLGNLPNVFDSITNLNISVSSLAATHYRYKIVPVLYKSRCTTLDDYGPEVDISSNITDDISNFPSGQPLQLCAIGKDASGNWLNPNLAASYSWYKGQQKMYKLPAVTSTHQKQFYDFSFAPTNNNFICALGDNGVMYTSANRGTSWTETCRVAGGSASNNSMRGEIKVSPGADGTCIYINSYDGTFLIQGSAGSSCKKISTGGADFAQSGNLYAINSVNNTGSNWNHSLIKSTDSGSTFATISENFTFSSYYYFNSLLVDRANENKISAAIFNRQMFQSTNNGSTFTTRNSPGWNWDASINFISHPSNPSLYVYGTQYDTSGLANGYWYSIYPNNTFIRFNMDATKHESYNLQANTSASVVETTLYRSTDFYLAGNGTWTPLFTFSNYEGVYNNNTKISAVGDVIGVIIGNRLLISSDAGVTFQEKERSDNKPDRILKFAQSNDTFYGLTANENVVKSTNLGQTWSTLKSGFSSYSYYDQTRYFPSFFVTEDSSPLIGYVGYQPAAPYYLLKSFSDVPQTDFLGSLDQYNLFSAKKWQDSATTYLTNSYGAWLKTTDNGASYVLMPELTLASNPYAITQNPVDSNLLWIPYNYDFFVYNLTTKTSTNIRNNVNSNNTYAGMEVFDNGTTHTMRIVDVTGRVYVSTNYGVSWNSQGSGASLSTNAKVMSATANRNRVWVTYTPSIMTYTDNNGAAWNSFIFDSQALPLKNYDGCTSFMDSYVNYTGSEYEVYLMCGTYPSLIKF